MARTMARRLPLLLICLLLATGAGAATEPAPSEAALAAGLEAREAGDGQAAAEHFRRAAELGSSEAAFWLASMYEHGEGVGASMNKAMEWYRRAAEGGSERAQFNLAHHYATGRHVDKDAAEAARWYRESAEQNNPHAQFALGLMRFHGEKGVSVDLVEAYRWITLAVLHFDANHFRDDAADARGAIMERMSEEQIAAGRELVNAHRGDSR